MSPLPAGLHISRGWNNTHMEDGCPCPKAECGFVVADTVDPKCPEHSLTAAKTLRSMHEFFRCPGAPDAS
jgi:hypothetical protein